MMTNLELVILIILYTIVYVIVGWCILQLTYFSKGDKYDCYSISYLILWPISFPLVLIVGIIENRKSFNDKPKGNRR